MKSLIVSIFIMISLEIVKSERLQVQLYSPNKDLVLFFRIHNYTHKPFEIDLESQYTYFLSNSFKKDTKADKDPYFTGEFSIQNVKVKGKVYKDDWELEGINEQKSEEYLLFHDLDFIVFGEENFFRPYASVAFSHKITEPKYSLTHILYNNKTIDKLKFNLRKGDYKDTVYLIFGDLDSKTTDKLFSQEIKIKKDSQLWSFNLEYIYLGNNFYLNNRIPAHFSSSISDIITPPNVFELFKKHYLNAHIYNGSCFERESIINCNCDDVYYLSNISLVIDGKSFVLSTKELFDNNSDQCYFIFRKNSKRNSDNFEWIVGIKTLWEKIITFDYENNNVVIYTKNQVLDFNPSNFKPIKDLSLLYSSIFICVIGILFEIRTVINFGIKIQLFQK